MDQIKEFLATNGWLLLIVGGVAFMFMKLAPAGTLAALKGLFINSDPTTPATPAKVTQAQALEAYNTLHVYCAHCPEGTKQLEALWPHLEPGHITASDTKPAEVK